MRSAGAELFRAGGQTDMTKLTVAFRISVNAPKSLANIDQAAVKLLVR
jgi:hypothetical protein